MLEPIHQWIQHN